MPRVRATFTACAAVAASAIALAAPAIGLASAPPPQNPFLAANPFSNLHNDTWMSNVYATIAGLDRGGGATVTWRAVYPNSHIHKPGQVDAGSGTTPAILPGGYMAITDNADPMDVVVYRTVARLQRGQRRLVCRVPVFGNGASDTENSLIADGRSLVVENNYGYEGYAGADANAETTPGFARVDIDRGGNGCHRVWQTDSLAAPSVVPKLSVKTGLVYTYVREAGATAQWAWAALSLRTGRTAFTVPTGIGTFYNNNYASISLGPTGNAFLSTIGGITELRRR